MSELKKFSLVKPTLQTPFHVDFDWWRANDENWHVALESMLCAEHQAAFAALPEGQSIDWVDPETAEVHQMDGLQYTLIQHCAKQPGFLDEHTAIVEAIFRVLLANGNTPMSPEQLGARLNRPADTILKTIAGPRVYKGLRPYLA
ncbi:MAG TPA: hypothetical protein VMT91_12205 [Anaerolineales bacterium]|nr:hypothetical protein [Anaerolineales bacterium]